MIETLEVVYYDSIYDNIFIIYTSKEMINWFPSTTEAGFIVLEKNLILDKEAL